MANTDLDEMTDLTSPFDAKGLAFLGRVQKLLLNITQPRVAATCAKSGYNADEHVQGWGLLCAASGTNRPFSHFLSQAEQAVLAGDVKTKVLVKWLDEFENTWFPRCRNAIRRFVVEEKRQATEAAFFDNLEQQPEGPGVVGSVSMLLQRIEGLRTSKVPGGDAACRALEQKGLTAAALAEASQKVADARAAAGALPEATVSEAEQRAAAEAQVQAFRELKLWYTDWADTLRQELGYHDQLKLGLRAPPRHHKAGQDQDAGEEPGPKG
jgi:hypothetical protein